MCRLPQANSQRIARPVHAPCSRILWHTFAVRQCRFALPAQDPQRAHFARKGQALSPVWRSQALLLTRKSANRPTLAGDYSLQELDTREACRHACSRALVIKERQEQCVALRKQACTVSKSTQPASEHLQPTGRRTPRCCRGSVTTNPSAASFLFNDLRHLLPVTSNNVRLAKHG